MTEDKKTFLPLEAVKELAKLRKMRGTWEKDFNDRLAALTITEEHKAMAESDRNLQIVQAAIVKAEAAFKAGCEEIFEETDEKKFPGGQIKMRTIFEYNENLAIKWAIKHDHPELLKIIKKEFKDACKALAPKFVRKDKIGKMHIDSDLSQYLEGDDVEEN